MNFFESFRDFFEDRDSLVKLMEILGLDKDEAFDKIVTFHSLETGEIVLSVFTFDEFEMIKEMSEILNKEVEDIVRGLGPDEVQQVYIHPDQGLPWL